MKKIRQIEGLSRAKNRFMLLVLVMILLSQSSSAFAGYIYLESIDQEDSGGVSIFIKEITSNKVKVDDVFSKNLKVSDFLKRESINSLKDYALWLSENIKYSSDGIVDSWAVAEETISKRQGDCEDFAFLNKAALEVLGYKPQIIIMKNKGSEGKHAICIFKNAGRYFYFNNAILKKTSTTSVKQFVEYMKAMHATELFSMIDKDDVSRKLINLEGIPDQVYLAKSNGVLMILAKDDKLLNSNNFSNFNE